MRSPDAEAGRYRCNAEPDSSHLALRASRMVENIDGRQRSEGADDGCEQHQIEIVGRCNAIIDLEHELTADAF